MATFSINGNFKLGSQWKNFKKEVTAETEEHARELLFKTFGSKNGLPRRFINIAEIAEIDHSVVLNEKPTKISTASDD